MKTAFLAFAVSIVAAGQTPNFDYDRTKPLEMRTAGTEMRGDVRVDDVSFANLTGARTAAYLVSPPGRGKTAGALYVHWFNPGSPSSNRTQFLEAVAVSRNPVVRSAMV